MIKKKKKKKKKERKHFYSIEQDYDYNNLIMHCT